jgi:DNA polymerase-3 subunit epsilon
LQIAILGCFFGGNKLIFIYYFVRDILAMEPKQGKKMLLKDKPILFVDCETTGLDDEYHEIISIALVRRHDGKTWTFKAKPNWPDHIDPRATAVNGYTPSAWMDAMSQEELANKLGILMKDYIIVGHNPRFDVGFIKNLLWRHKIKTYIDPRAIDTTTLAYLYLVPFGLNSLSMDSIRRFLGWKVYPTHEALQDTKDVERLYNTLAHPIRRFSLKIKLWMKMWKK